MRGCVQPGMPAADSSKLATPGDAREIRLPLRCGANLAGTARPARQRVNRAGLMYQYAGITVQSAKDGCHPLAIIAQTPGGHFRRRSWNRNFDVWLFACSGQLYRRRVRPHAPLVPGCPVLRHLCIRSVRFSLRHRATSGWPYRVVAARRRLNSRFSMPTIR